MTTMMRVGATVTRGKLISIIVTSRSGRKVVYTEQRKFEENSEGSGTLTSQYEMTDGIRHTQEGVLRNARIGDAAYLLTFACGCTRWQTEQPKNVERLVCKEHRGK